MCREVLPLSAHEGFRSKTKSRGFVEDIACLRLRSPTHGQTAAHEEQCESWSLQGMSADTVGVPFEMR